MLRKAFVKSTNVVIVAASNLDVYTRTFHGRATDLHDFAALWPECHAGFGAETTRPLLRAILRWVHNQESSPEAAGAPLAGVA